MKPTRAASPDPPQANILLVDDTPANLVALRAILEPLGQNLVVAGSGREALRHLLDTEFALILMDVRMGDMDGFETARLIRQRPHTADVPIMFLTAFDRAEIDVSAGYEVNAADFVFKPFQPDALRAKVGVFVDLFQKTEAMRLQAERLRQMEQREHRRRLEQAERGRRAAEARFENILALAGDAILALDEGGHVLLFNAAAEEIFGYSADEVVGGPVKQLIPVELRAEGPAPVEVTAVRKGGVQFPAEVSISHLRLGDEVLTSVICRDITERRRNEERERELNRELHDRLRMGVDMVASLAASLNPGEVMERVLGRVVTAADGQLGALLRVERGGRLVVQESYDRDRAPALRRGTEFAVAGVLERALRAGAAELNGRLPADGQGSRVREWLEGVTHTAALPLRVGDDTAAVILLGRRNGVPFGDRELDILNLIGNVAAVALRNAELFTAAEAASVSKSEFLNMAAHELRTPLSVITGYLSMLEDGTLGDPSQAWRGPIGILNVKAGELNKLVDALLLAARMEAGTIQGDPSTVDLASAAREALRRAEPRGHLLGADLRLVVPAEPVLVEADPNHVARILDNLINNALTYSSEAPWVKVSVGSPAEVVVEDRGLGVPEDRREAIFERFFRVNDPSLPPQPGTGLGLYLSRELARRYGGDVTLEESRPGHGSRFVLNLHRAAVDASAGGPGGAVAEEPAAPVVGLGGAG